MFLVYQGVIQEDLADCENLRELVQHSNPITGGESEAHAVGDEVESRLPLR